MYRDLTRLCEFCQKPFKVYRAEHRWCSASCRFNSHRDEINRLRRLAHAQDPSKKREENRRSNYKRYNLTVEEVQFRIAAQQGVCAICFNPPKEGGRTSEAALHVDHNHVTGENRGMLCAGCNKGLGCFKESPEFLRAAADYLELNGV